MYIICMVARDLLRVVYKVLLQLYMSCWHLDTSGYRTSLICLILFLSLISLKVPGIEEMM